MRALLLISALFTTWSLAAQCTSFINSFPNTESFETSAGNWTSGGQASDWAWGTPNKALIRGGAVGQKCWIAGGLIAPAYNPAENSWLMSPCYDFSSLT